MEPVESSDDERTENRARRDRGRARRVSAETEEPLTPLATPAEKADLDRLDRQLSNRIERECAGLRAELTERIQGVSMGLSAEIAGLRDTLSERIDGTRELLEHRIDDRTRQLQAESASLKELLLSRLEQQEKARAAEYSAMKWSIRSMMAAMALLVAMMARFTLLQ
jgi:hypothetical protein